MIKIKPTILSIGLSFLFFSFNAGEVPIAPTKLLHIEKIDCNTIAVSLTDNYRKDGNEMLIIEAELSDQVWVKEKVMIVEQEKVFINDLVENNYRVKVLPSQSMKSEYGMDYYKLGYISNQVHLNCNDKGYAALSIWPNPTSEAFIIKEPIDEKSELIIYDIHGKIVFTNSSLKSRNVTIDQLPVGIYLIVLNNKEGLKSAKLIKQ